MTQPDAILEPLPVLVRPVIEADLGFILNSWLKSYRDSAWAKAMPAGVYYAHHEVVAKLLLLRASQAERAFVICDESDPEHLFGWIVANENAGGAVLHFVYVKSTYRGKGLARRLLSAAGITHDSKALFSHWTYASEKHLKSVCAGFNPYKAFGDYR